mgnify:FL=1
MILIARIKQIVDGLLQYIQYDYESVPEHETFLYHMFYGTRDGSFDFYEQAKKLFLRTNTSPRKIQVKMEYPKDKSQLPCIIVREPGRSTDKPAPLGGYGAPVLDTFGGTEYEREGFRQPALSKIDLMCFSENMLESILMGEVIYALLIGARNTFEEEFAYFDFSTNELIAENALFPQPILVKNVSIEVEDIGDYASIIRPEIVRRFIIEDAIPVGSDPGWVPPPLDKYFEFSNPYVWLDSLLATGENTIYSNTDWVLSVGDELFKFGSGYVWLDEMNNKGEQEIEAKTPWRLE